MPSATAVYSPIGLPGGGETDSPRVPQPRPARLLAARLLAPMLSLAIALMLALPADAARLRVGVYGQDPPLSFIDSNGQLASFDIDFARALCRQAGFDCELIQTDWQELLPALVRRRLDAVVASLSITDERRELVAFTRPYYDSPGRFIIARSGRFDELDPETLTGVQIGVPRQTTFDRYATDTLSEWAEIHRYTTRQDALADLVLGRTDLVIGDHIALRENFLATEVGEGFELVGEPLADSRWFGDGIGVAVAKGDTALLERLDQAIGELHRNGVFDLIRRRCFDYGIRNLTATLRAEEAARHAESAP